MTKKQYRRELLQYWIYVTCFIVLFTIILTHSFIPRIEYRYKEVMVPVPTETIVEVMTVDPTIAFIEKALPTQANGAFKTFEYASSITNPSSGAWHLKHLAAPNAKGLMMLNDKYLVAMGSFYAAYIGQEFRVTLSSGRMFYVIVGDLKQDRHTDSNHQYMPENGNIIEFIVDVNKLPAEIKALGDVSSLGLEGSIVKIEEVRYAQ